MKFLWRYVLPMTALVAASLLLVACEGEEEEEAEGLATVTPAAATETATSTETVTPEGEVPTATPAAATETAAPTETPTPEGEEAASPSAATPPAPTEVAAPTEAATPEEDVDLPDVEEALEEYLEDIEDVLERYDDDLDDAREVCEEAWEEDDLTDAAEAALTCEVEIVPILEQILAEVGNIDPPAEVQDAHRALVAAGAGMLAAVQGLVDQLPDIETASDFAAQVGEVVPTFFAFEGACLELQELADDLDLDVDLECE